MRSKLFVPGARPDFFAKALSGAADALSFDLEDAVAESLKVEARVAVAAFVISDAALSSGKVLIVRTNALDSPHFQADLAAVVRQGVDLINLPKIESAEDVLAAVQQIEAAEHANGVGDPVGLLVNIETPAALFAAARIASAHPRIKGLQLGLGDLFEPNAINRADPRNVHAAMFALRMAAAQAGVFAMDGAYAVLDDDAGYAEEAAMARGLGFVGKTCVHPRQVPLANAVFAPSEAELAQARRIVDAARAAGKRAEGAFAIDGKMVDAPFLRRAKALLAIAKRSS
ncbi:MAG: HpcH/HpaI aldolase/citrate lyase family protein [Thermomonas sp.]